MCEQSSAHEKGFHTGTQERKKSSRRREAKNERSSKVLVGCMGLIKESRGGLFNGEQALCAGWATQEAHPAERNEKDSCRRPHLNRKRFEIRALAFVSFSKGLGSRVGRNATLGAPSLVELWPPVAMLGEALFF